MASNFFFVTRNVLATKFGDVGDMGEAERHVDAGHVLIVKKLFEMLATSLGALSCSLGMLLGSCSF